MVVKTMRATGKHWHVWVVDDTGTQATRLQRPHMSIGSAWKIKAKVRPAVAFMRVCLDECEFTETT